MFHCASSTGMTGILASRPFKVILCVLACFVVFLCCAEAPGLKDCGCAAAAQQDGAPSVKAVVEKDSVFTGEPFMLQIRLEGVDITPGTEQPDMSAVSDFTVEYQGGQNNNSSSVFVVNGKVNKVESYGYVYSYRLTARKAGQFEIPAITVPIDKFRTKTLRTEPIKIRVAEPEESEDFHLELKFSKTTFYVGEPVILSVIWYIGKDVETLTFNLPLLEDQSFSFADIKKDQDPRKQYFQIQAGGSNALAEKGTGTYNGKEYTTLSFKKVIFAKKAGAFQTPEASVSCKCPVGFARPQQRRSPFDGFFDDSFFNPGRKEYKTFVTRANPAVLTVLALPEEGKPTDFSGHVGRFRVEASAGPTEVNIGDPITLDISISGSDYLENVELPPLSKNPEIEKDFKVPDEMASGTIHGDAKQFTQTLRPKSDAIKAIPPIRFSYFNPDTARYETAQSRPIALSVKPTKVLTSTDVEGKPGQAVLKKSELENWSQGIAYNYEGPEVLEKEVYRVSRIVRSPLWLAVILLPFSGFALLLIITQFRQRRLADPEKLRSRKALAGFRQRVRAIGAEAAQGVSGCALLLEALRIYLGDKLRDNGPALTFSDIERILRDKGVDAALSGRLKDLFDACERGSYGAMDLGRPFHELVDEAVELVRSLDRVVS